MPRPRDIILETLRQEAILTSEGVSESYGFGFTSTGGDPEEVTAIIVIGHVGDRFLVAVPHAVWNRRADKRHLPPGALEKPISVSVAGCTAAAREVAVVEFTVRLWVGWLKKSLRTEIDFAEPAEVQHRFVDEDSQTPCFPFATALMDVAEEKFQFVSKAGEEAKPDPDRLAALEERFSTLQDTLDRLLQMRSGGESGFVTASGAPLAAHSKMSPPAPPVSRKPPKAPPGLTDLHGIPGLDPGTVAAALQAGIPRGQLERMGSVLHRGPSKLEDFPRPAGSAAPNLADSEEDIDGVPLEEEEVQPPATDPMVTAVVKLTEIMSKLTKGNSASAGDNLEDALDQVGSVPASGSGDISASMGRKHAAARRALAKAFNEDAGQIWKSIEANMAKDFNLQSAMPNASTGFSARGWCEHRSKIQPYIRTCRWVWGIAGILDNLRLNQVDQARARCCLLLAAAEQESLDHGSFLLSQEILMEPAVPISSFQNHVLPDAVEMATTRLLDPRWIEAFADRLKQLDSYVEMRKKLNLRPRSQAAPAPQPKGGVKGKGKGQKGKAKDREGEGEAATLP